MQLDRFLPGNETAGEGSGRIVVEPLALVLFVVFCALAYVARSYGEAGLFPLLFLLVGAFSMGIHLIVINLPGKYGTTARSLLKTDAETVSSVGSSTDESDSDTTDEISYRNIAIVITTMGVFYVVFYFYNFLVATPIYILLTGYWLGLRNYYLLVALTAIITVLVYLVFGEIMNTPILE